MEAVRVRKPKSKKPKEKIHDNEENEEFLPEISYENGHLDEEALTIEKPEVTREDLPPEKPALSEPARAPLDSLSSQQLSESAASGPVSLDFPTGEHEAAEKSKQPTVIHVEPINQSTSELHAAVAARQSRSSSLLSAVRPAPAIPSERPGSVVKELPSQERAGVKNPLAKEWTAEAVRSSVTLYPSLLEKQKVVTEPKPLSRGEMQIYFVNAEAKALEGIVDQFVESNSIMCFYRHPLYIYLNEYLKAITAYEAATIDMKKLQRLYEQSREDVWKITDNRVSDTGRCADNKTVTGEHFYRQCHLNKVALTEMESHLEAIRQFLYDTSFRSKCTAELARFQVECYLFDVLRNNPAIGGLRDNSATVARNDFQKVPQTSEVRNCVAVLFAFHRMPLGSDKFRVDIKAWLSGCVGILCRASTFFDQLFLLNHLLRCPSSVLQWASFFVQLSVPNEFSGKNCNNPYVKHLVVMLQCLLLPPKARDDFLSAFAINQSGDDNPDTDSSWIVVDPDAEGVEVMKLTTTMDVDENDVFYLLKQFPFDGLFSRLFGSDCVDLNPFVGVAEYDVLGLFAFCHEFLELVVQGLDNPALNKYPRFNKKCAQIIRELIVHCKEFWERLIEVKNPNDPVLLKLRLNFEELVLRGMSLLHKHTKNGTMQFLVGWPTKCLSLGNIWRAIVILENPADADVPHRGDVYFWKKQLADLQAAGKLQEKLQLLDESNSTYLLTAIAEVVKQCDKALPVSDLVESVTVELLRISFLGPLRTTYSKLGRDLVSSVCYEYPDLISEVAKFAWKNLDQIGSMGVFLFQEMPLKRWKVERSDVEVMCERLVGAKTIQDHGCLLAREILSNLNWGLAAHGALYIPSGIHQYVAVAIVEAFLKFISTKNRRLLLYESLLRLSSMVTTGKSTPEQNFVGWCWEVLLELKLHRLTQHSGALPSLQNNTLIDDNVPNLERDAMSLSPLQAVQQRQPIACYVAVMLTDVGHSTTGVLSQGLDWISALVENYLYIPALETLEVVTPLFFHNNQSVYLLQQDQCHSVLNSILQADATYVRMVKNILVTEFPGKTLKSFGNMVIHQLLHSGPNLTLAVRFWCRVLTALKNWNRTPETLYILDQVVKFAFYAHQLNSVLDVLREAYEEYRQSQPARGGGMTALVSWMTSASSPAYILVDSTKLAEAPWLAYVVLQVISESNGSLWSSLLDILTAEKKRTFEEGLKKAAHKMDISVPVVSDLPIFQLAEVITAVHVESEIFPLLCQEFFRLFLRRSSSHGSIGDQFFLSAQAIRVMKPLKQKLRDAAEYYRKRATALEERSPKFYQDLQHAVRAFALWMDEPKIHHANFYLPSLPAEYDPELLRTVLVFSSDPWMHFVDVQTIYASMRTQAEHWLPFEIRSPRRKSGSHSSPIRSQDTPLPPPSTYPASPPFVPVDPNSLLDPSKVLFALRPDLTALQEAAKLFVNRVTEHAALDGYFLELISELNVNTEKQITVYPTCHKSQCVGPAEIQLKYKEFSRNDPVHRTYLQNREEWNGFVLRAQKIDLKALVMSVVRFEKAISMLIEAATTGGPRVAEVGAILFYHMLVFIGYETDEHPLTRKFFHSSVDVLGHNFVANQKAQCRPLLETCLNNQRAIPMLISHFTPNIVPQEFLPLYKKSQQTLQGKNNEALIQLLSTFDIRRYLNEQQVDVSARLELLSTISRGITQLGSTPSFQDYPLFETYAHHMRSLLEFRFPLHVIDVLRCLLDLTSKSVLPPNGWSSCFFSALGIALQTDSDVTAAELENNFATIRAALADGKISLDLAIVISEEVNRFFGDIRRGNKTASSFGLFSVLGQYCRAVGVLYMTLLAVSLRDDQKTEGTFIFAVKLFQAWLNEEHAFLEADLPHATSLITALRLIFSEITAKSPEILRQIWQWFYYSFSVKPTPSYIITAIADELVKLPWGKFLPDDLCLQNFTEIIESGPIESKWFLATVAERIPWQMSFAVNNGGHLIPFVTDTLKVVMFFATADPFRPFEAGIAHFISETKDFQWSCLDFATVQLVADKVARDPEQIATWCVAPVEIQNSTVVALLKLITEFEADNLSPNRNTVEKRAFFLHVYGRAAVAYYATRNTASLTAFIVSILKTVDKVWESADPTIRYHGNLALASEILSLSNYVSNKKVEDSIRGAILTWIPENPGSLLLVPMIAACCRSVVNIETMVAYVEILMVSYFRAVGQHDWMPVVHALEVPELNGAEFAKDCLAKKAFLTLYAHLQRQLQTADGSRRGELLQQVGEWCKVRPTMESQAKVFLLWDQVLMLGTSDTSERAKTALRDFIEAIFNFTEEKGGLLSVVGVGKPPALSRPFKLVARSVCAVASPLTSARRATGKSATLSVDTRSAYEAMKTRKEYAQYTEIWSIVDGYLASQGGLDWSDVRKLLATLLMSLFKEFNFLTIIISGL